MTKTQHAWYAQNEAEEEDAECPGAWFLIAGPKAFEPERDALKEAGAPDTDEIEFISIEPEDRDEAIVEANITEALWAWMLEEGIAIEDE